MLTNFTDTPGSCCETVAPTSCCSTSQYKLKPECQMIWDCLTCCIPKPIKESCLIPRTQINKFITDMMN